MWSNTSVKEKLGLSTWVLYTEGTCYRQGQGTTLYIRYLQYSLPVLCRANLESAERCNIK